MSMIQLFLLWTHDHSIKYICDRCCLQSNPAYDSDKASELLRGYCAKMQGEPTNHIDGSEFCPLIPRKIK